MKRIIYIHHGKDIGGAAISLVTLAEKLKDFYKVKVILLYPSSAVDLFKKKNIPCEVIHYPFHLLVHSRAGRFYVYKLVGLVKILLSWRKRIHYIRHLLEGEKPDLVHLNSTFLPEWAQAAKASGIPAACHIREPLGNGIIIRNIIRRMLKQSSERIIAISKDNAQRLDLPDKTTVSYNFVDFSVFNPDLYDRKKTKTIRVAYLGGQAEIKGFSWLVESLRYLDPRIGVFFAGYYKSPDDSWKGKAKNILSLQRRRNQKSLKALTKAVNAERVGVVRDIPRFLSGCDLLVFPSTRPHFARPVMEAQAMGLPVVVSDVPGNGEIVQNGSNGYLVKKNDAKGLAEKINLLAGDNELRQIMGKRGRAMARKKFDSKKNIQEIRNVYQNILNS